MSQLQTTTGHSLIEERRYDPGDEYASYGTQLDGSRLSAFIRQNYRLFLLVLVLTLALTIAYTAMKTPIFTTKSSVMLDQRKLQVVQGLDDVVSALPSDSSVVDTEVEVLNSSGMAFRVAQRQGLIGDVDFSALTEEQQQQISQTIEKVMANRSAGRVGLTYLIDIYYSSPDPAEAQSFANQYAQTYLDSQVAVRVQANENARNHLEEQIAGLQVEVKTADAAVARYKAATGLNSTAGGTLTEQEISSYNQTLAMARAQAAEDSQRLAAARGQGMAGLGTGVSPTLGQLRAQQAMQSSQVADLTSRYGPLHPELVTAQRELDDIDRLIVAESQRSVAGLAGQASASAGRASAIASRLSATEAELARAGQNSVRLRELESQLEAPQTLLEAYQARLAQIATQSGAEQPDARIVALAPLPLAPTSPSWFANLALGLVLGSILGLAAVMARRVLSVGVGSPEEVENAFGVEFLAALPRIKSDDDIAIIDHVVDQQGSAFSEAVRGLAASIFYNEDTHPRVVAMTSPYAEEGKTCTTLALGRTMALRGRKVLVVDCDLQRPAFTTRFGLGSELGLADVLQGRATLEQTVVSDPRTRADILPFGQHGEAGLTLDHDRFLELISILRENYDIVLLDLPPLLQVAETRLITAAADGAVLLARWKQTSRQSIEYALSILNRSGSSVVGVALTHVPMSSEVLLGNYGSTPNKWLKRLPV